MTEDNDRRGNSYAPQEGDRDERSGKEDRESVEGDVEAFYSGEWGEFGRYFTAVPEGIREVRSERAGSEEGDGLMEALPMPSARPGVREGPLVLLTSFPTSGNGFVRHFFSGCTDIATLKPGGSSSQAIYKMFPWGPSYLDRGGVGWLPPAGGEPALLKTHYPTTVTESGLDDVSLEDYFDGVILLVRNPGDTITRNHLRWSLCRDTHADLEARFLCYDRNAEDACRIGPTPWVEHQEYWIRRLTHSRVPHLLLRYEDAVERPGEVLRELLDFVFNGTQLTYNREWFRLQLETQARHVGSGDMGQFIGKCAAADRGHIVEPTRETFEKLGYSFQAGAAFTWTSNATISGWSFP